MKTRKQRNNTARYKAARKAKLRKARKRAAGLLKKKANRRLA
ncbi:MAG: hypothetical protein ACE366_25305 [Bradymonadia bacterium]